MCNRISVATTPRQLDEAVREVLNLDRLDELPFPLYNVAPRDRLPAVRLNDEGQPEWAVLRWGLIPSWAKDETIASRTLNARSETISEKPAFRSAYRHRRCLLPVTHFYDWVGPKGRKQPFAFQLKDEPVFTLAGLWESWSAPTGEVVETFTVAMTEANDVVAPVHDRMPVIVDEHEREVWLSADADTASHVLRVYPAERMTSFPTSTAMNNVRNKGPEAVERVEIDMGEQGSLFD